MEMDNSSQRFGGTEVLEVRDALTKIYKQGRRGVGTAAVLAGINVLLGAALIFFSGIGVATFDLRGTLGGIVTIIYGLVFLGLSLGIQRRNRGCAIAALAVLGLDSLQIIVSGESLNWNVLGWMIRAALVWGTVVGVIACFKYHALARAHLGTLNAEIAEIMQNSKPKIKIWQIILYAIIAIIGLGALVYVGF